MHTKVASIFNNILNSDVSEEFMLKTIIVI